ncbi:MAG: hypothetical protein JNM56_33085 [Planctomycetia bacterium]|nr:hypothetical protein [Planctomycetia bacterium]
MPTNRRRRVQRRRQQITVLTVGQRYHLETGMHLLDGFDDRATFEAAWEMHRPDIMADFAAQQPGRRPFAWWLLDHGEERPVLHGRLTAAELQAIRDDERRGMYFGYLHCEGLQESEVSYLRRRGLLTAEERKLDADGRLDELAEDGPRQRPTHRGPMTCSEPRPKTNPRPSSS